MTHSPAPWSVDPEGEVAVSIEDANGSVVCDVYGASSSEVRAGNASLIAAAPRLLRAAELALTHMKGIAHPADVQEVERAIAEAKGAV